MDPVLTFLTAYALGIASSSSWDAIKLTVGKVFKSRVDLDNLFVDCFLRAIELHAAGHDETATRYTTKLKREIGRNRQTLIEALNAVSYQDYGVLLASIENQEFQRRLATELMLRYRFDDKENVNSAILLEAIITDLIGFYRLAILQKLSNEETQRLTLLQSLKIDNIRTSIEDLRQSIVSRAVLVDLLSESRAMIIRELREYIRLYTQQYDSNRVSIDAAIAEADKQILLKDLQRILYANSFRPVPVTEKEVDIVTETKGIFPLRIALRGEARTEPVTVDHVLAFKVHFPRTAANHGYFISTSGFTAEALQQADQSLDLFSYAQFTNNLVDFGEYIEHVIADYENSKLFRNYESILGFDEAHPEDRDLVKEIDETLNAGRPNKIAIFGDFGMGKTTLCKHYLYLLAKRYKENPLGNRIPVMVPLGQYDKGTGIHASIAYILQQQGVDINPQLCTELQRMGRFVFLFDGFDEMTLYPDKFAIQQNLRELEKVAQIGANKLILTSRTHFFRDKIDQAKLIGYKFFLIREWGTRQLESYLRKSLGKEWVSIRNQIVESAALWELAKTPLFAEMMTTTLPSLDERDPSAARLFEVFTDRWIRDQDYRTRMSENEKRAFMSELACLLFFGNRFSVHYSELRDVVRRTFNLQVIEEVDYFDNDTRTCSFLVRDDHGNYRFSHRSFMEYFVAKTLATELVDLADAVDIGESLEKYHFHKRKLTNEVYMFLSQMQIDPGLLVQMIRSTRRQAFERVRYMGSNAVSVLRSMNFDLSGADLSNCMMVDADFGGMDLTGANFSSANLYTASFNNCKLDNVNMNGANLRYCSIKGLGGIFDILVDIIDNVSVVGTMLHSLFLIDLASKKIIDRIDGHSDGIWTLAQLNEELKIAAGGRDNSVRLWDVSSKDLLRSFDGHIDNVWRIISDSEGKRLASCSSDRLVKVWNPDDTSPEVVLKGHTDEVRDLAFIGTNTILSCSLDKTLAVWDLRSRQRREYQGEEEYRCLAVSHDERFIIIGNTKGWVTALTFPNLEVYWQRKLHEGAVRTIAFSPTDYRFASGGGDGKVIISELNQPDQPHSVLTHKGFVNRVRFKSDGSQVVSVGYDSSVYIASVTHANVQVVDLRDAIYRAGNRFSCKNLILTGSTGLSPEKLQDLKAQGAIF